MLKIIPSSSYCPAKDDLFFQSVQKNVNEVLSEDVKNEIEKGKIQGFLKSLPIFRHSEVQASFWITFLCQAEYTQGVGRYVNDALCRWLVPGKNLAITGITSLHFSFQNFPHHRFYFKNVLFEVGGKEDIEIIQRNILPLFEEIRLNILAVYHARYIASLRSISTDQKSRLIQENLNKILNLPREADCSLYDQMHNFVMKVIGDQKMGQVKKTIAQLVQSRPKSFDREVFYEMTHFTVLFKDQFASRRDPRYIGRVIALYYLFKKSILDSIRKEPNERHIIVKIFKTAVNKTQQALGVLLAVNILRETERFDRRFLLDAIRACLPDVQDVKDSYISDWREKKASFFYLEVTKESSFKAQEIQKLRAQLPTEVKKQVESDVHPIFLPRNEEDVARNLILLSQQLKYSRDLPQVSIHYEKQTESELFFSVLLTRLLHPQTKGLRTLFVRRQKTIKFFIEEMREIGKLKKRIPKEAAILRVSIDKTPFFRPDYSVDLLRARQKIAYELSRIIGEYRDFNGGMILKQEESLLALRKHLGPISPAAESLLEEFFYSLRPGIMQTALPTEALKAHFQLLQTLPTHPTGEAYQILEDQMEKFFFFFATASDPAFKDHLDIEIEKLKIPSYELATCSLELPPLFVKGYLLRSEKQELAISLKKAIEFAMKNWNDTLYCTLNPAEAIQ
ncbi:MAG: hypothetical protein KGJ02_08265 [Verrucomicrobiota bacterium]|nr:hypothetical protein [Verrucomicrobiota bacterium]